MSRIANALPLLSDYVKKHALERPESKAFIAGEEVITYKELHERSEILAKYLLKIGVQKGDRIAHISTPQPEFFYLYIAASRIGAIIVGMGTKYTAREYEYIIKSSQAEYIFCRSNLGTDYDYQARIAEVLPQTPWVKNVIVHGAAPVVNKGVSFEEIMTCDYSDMNTALAEREATVTEQDGLLIVFTSGTTGNPKGALLSNQNIVDVALVTADETEGGPYSIVLNQMPVNHVSGATEVAATAFVAGCVQVLLDVFNPQTVLEYIEKYQIDTLAQVPTMYAIEFTMPKLDQYNLSSVKQCMVSGSPLSEDVATKIVKYMCPNVRNCLGMTETAGIFTWTKKGASAQEISSSIGKVSPEFEYKLVDKNRNEVNPGNAGELAYRGTNVFKGYYGLPEETAKVIDAEGWFYSGDLAMLGEDGELHLMGRSSEMYISGGNNVYPAEIEDVIGNFENVLFVACLPIPDPIWGEYGRAYIVPTPGTSINEDNLKQYLQANLAKYKIPREFVYRDMLPLTAIGKVDKKVLKQELV